MKRHALLIGYTGWDIKGSTPLRGVSLDLKSYRDFLMSPKGGGWYENEITILEDKSLLQIQTSILMRKKEQNDIVFTVFSGHGDYDDVENYCRRFEVSKSETILEKDLLGLAKKQILICDCCSGLRSESMINESKAMLTRDFINSAHEYEILMARRKYEELCQQCQDQTLIFYAAKAGSFAEDTAQGGRYTRALINVLTNVQSDTNMFQAHNAATIRVENESSNKQTPDYSVPKVHNFLPGAIVSNRKLYS